MKHNFCDYCDCTDDDGNVRTDLSHAQTVDGRWVCDICYYYDLCVMTRNDPNPSGPCRDDCKHRPKLMTKWATF